MDTPQQGRRQDVPQQQGDRGRSQPVPGPVLVRRGLAGVEPERVLDGLSAGRPGHVPAGVPVADDVAAAARVAPLAASGELSVRAVRDIVSEEEMLTHPYCTIGVLLVRPRDRSAGWFPGGSGVLVGPYHLLTATHVLRNEHGKGFPMSDYEHDFVPAYHRGPRGVRARSSSSLTGRTVEAGPRDDPGGWNIVSGWDFVVCELDPADRLGEHWGWMAVGWGGTSFYQDRTWTSVGYPSSTADGQEPSRHQWVRVVDVEDDEHGTKEIETHDAVTRGWSGGPLFSTFKGQWVVGGVASGREWEGPPPFGDDTTYVYAGGERLGAVVDQAWRDWRQYDWDGWQDLGGQFPAGSSLAAVSRRPGQVELFGRGTDDRVWQTYRDPGTGQWSDWFPTAPGGVTVGSPTVLSPSREVLQLFIIGTDQKAWYCWWSDTDGAWSDWHDLGGQFHPGDQLTAVSRRPGVTELFGRGLDGRVWQTCFTPEQGSWSGWFPTAGDAATIGSPVALSTASDRVQLFAIGTDRQVWTAWWIDADGAWSLWQPLGGQFQPGDGIAALSRTAGLVELYGRGQDGAVWQDWWRAEDGWSGWFRTAPGGVAVGTPSVVVPPGASEPVELFLIGTDHKAWTSAWGPHV